MRRIVRQTLASEPAIRVDYAEIVDAATLEPVDRIEHDTLIALAAFVGETRLIDNLTISFDSGAVRIDEGLCTTGTTEEE